MPRRRHAGQYRLFRVVQDTRQHVLSFLDLAAVDAGQGEAGDEGGILQCKAVCV